MKGNGDTAPNPADEVINFDTATFSLRYGLTRRINLSATIPYQSIQSDKFQGASYSRLNRGLGDLLVTGEYRLGTSPQVTLEMGLELPTGNIDKRDELGQRICDILALGSGTTDFVIGAGFWMPHVLVHGLDITANIQHRFSGGENKYGYRFGDQTAFGMHSSHSVFGNGRVGLQLDGFHALKDTWYGNVVSERGATFLFAGPTVSWEITDAVTFGGFARFPVLMRLEGSQMVAPATLGVEFTADISSLAHALVPQGAGQ